jgi:serine/threonine protein kinase
MPENITPKYNQNSFEYICVVGRGGFGKVWKVVDKKSQKVYALKEMSKAL